MNGKGDPSGLFAAKRLSDHNRAEMREIFERAIRLAEGDRLRLRVPTRSSRCRSSGGCITTTGRSSSSSCRERTDFQFPREAFSLAPTSSA
jgi:hypothetical protein